MYSFVYKGCRSCIDSFLEIWTTCTRERKNERWRKKNRDSAANCRIRRDDERTVALRRDAAELSYMRPSAFSSSSADLTRSVTLLCFQNWWMFCCPLPLHPLPASSSLHLQTLRSCWSLLHSPLSLYTVYGSRFNRTQKRTGRCAARHAESPLPRHGEAVAGTSTGAAAVWIRTSGAAWLNGSSGPGMEPNPWDEAMHDFLKLSSATYCTSTNTRRHVHQQTVRGRSTEHTAREEKRLQKKNLRQHDPR